jgi:hypothetical protein
MNKATPAPPPSITMKYEAAEDETFTVFLTVINLQTEAQAHATMEHLGSLFCGKPIPTN